LEKHCERSLALQDGKLTTTIVGEREREVYVKWGGGSKSVNVSTNSQADMYVNL
jgi:hypothetical protein